MFFAAGTWVGVLAPKIAEGNDYVLIGFIVLAAVIAGFAKDTKSANNYWFKGNKE